jgi:hypothetical protein
MIQERGSEVSFLSRLLLLCVGGQLQRVLFLSLYPREKIFTLTLDYTNPPPRFTLFPLASPRQTFICNMAGASQQAQLEDYQASYLSLLLSSNILKFGGPFTLKSGRQSPYFFNAGLFCTGESIASVATCYAERIVKSGVEFDVIFGPAYKVNDWPCCRIGEREIAAKSDRLSFFSSSSSL